MIAAIANSYSQYLTTREEYAAQHFEGAFNLYGPWSGGAFIQSNDDLARDLVADAPTDLSTGD